MNKNFFTQLGDQLCKLKDSPFYRLHQQQQIPNSFHIQTNVNKAKKIHKQKQKNPDQSYLKQKNRPKQNQFNIQYDLLKKNANEEYLKQISKIQNLPRTQHKQPYSWFGIYRGACLLCGKCSEYQGCFSYSQKFSMASHQFIQNMYNNFQNSDNNHVEIMQCYKCKCPMNAHTPITDLPTLQGQIFNHLTSKTIQDNSLNFNHIVLSFKLPQSQLQNYYLILQLLNNLNCPVINYTIQSKLNFQLSMIRSTIIQDGNTQKSYIQSLLNLIQCIKLEKQWNWSDNPQQIHTNQIYQQLYSIINKVGLNIHNQTLIEQGYCVIIFLCKYQIQNVKNLIKYLSRNDHSIFSNNQFANQIRGSVASASTTSTTNFQNIDEQINQFQYLFQQHNIKFIYGTNTHKQSIILSQYFFKQNYQMEYNLFILPEGSASANSVDAKQNQFNSLRFKDILDFNNYIVFIENFKDIQRNKLQDIFTKILKFRSTKVNYILGEQVLHQKIQKLHMKLAIKIGISTLTIPFTNYPDFITIKNTNKMQIQKIIKNIHPQFTYSQRCIFIIRPFLMNSNFQQAIVNLLRINKFILLKRVRVKLSQAEVAYLATLQSIPQNMMEQYTKYMTAGVCEIILTSKRAALYEAYALAHGCLNGPSDIPIKALKSINRYNNQITVQIKKGRDTFEQQLPLYQNLQANKNIHYPNTSLQLFKSVRQLIDIQQVLFPHASPPQYSTNIKNGQIAKINPNNSKSAPGNQHISVTHKVKQSMLKELKKSGFNFWVFTSKSQTLTEQIAGIFLPQCTLFQPITVLVKPGLLHLVPLIKRSLTQHKYHIIFEKQLQMSQQTAKQFLASCQKIKLSNEIMKQLIKMYSKQKVYIFCLSKISGRKQIISMLSQFSFFSSFSQQNNINLKSSQHQHILLNNQDISDQMLYDMLVPVWNHQQLILRLVCEPLARLQQSILNICQNIEQDQQVVHRRSELTKLDKYLVLNYLVGSFYGISINDLDLNSRLGKLTYYILPLLQIAKLQSWYYSKISSFKANYIPLIFQYRQIGHTIVCIQSQKGVTFMQKLLQMYQEEHKKIKIMEEKQLNNFLSKPKKIKRRSLVLFLWAKKLVQLALDLNQVTTQLKNFGKIVFKNGEFQGFLTAQQAQKQQQQFLKALLDDFQDNPLIKGNIKKLLQSRHMKQRYLNQNKRLLPSFSLSSIQQSLRVVETTQASKLHLVDKFSFIDPQNQSQNLKDLYTLHLFNIIPTIRTKYSMLAQLYYFLIHTQLQNPHLSQIMTQISNIFIDLLIDKPDTDIIQFQIYLRYIIQYSKLANESQQKHLLISILKNYPNFNLNVKIDHDQVAGKKRKFLDHKQFIKRRFQESAQNKQIIQQKYLHFDLNTLIEKPQQSVLYNPNDPLHKRFASAQKRVNLLRDTHDEDRRKGIYVQFQKNISQKQQLLKQKIKKQVQKFNVHIKDQILHQTGLQKDLWYRRTKGQILQKSQSKTNQAIQKQIQKLNTFKQQSKKKGSQSSIK